MGRSIAGPNARRGTTCINAFHLWPLHFVPTGAILPAGDVSDQWFPFLHAGLRLSPPDDRLTDHRVDRPQSAGKQMQQTDFTAVAVFAVAAAVAGAGEGLLTAAI